jgi:eukaryotic-like serine/threonine-protein kinase
MGVVYLAEDTRLNRKVALKLLPPAIAQHPEARARFLREAQAASALDHPNVAPIYEIGDWDQQLFIAMAFYEGETLRMRLERSAMAVPEAAAILLQLATGLAAAHHAGIVHRDLKPANIMLTRGGQVKILDFGLAKMVSDSAQTVMEMTKTGTVVGTVAYMAPEQAQGSEIDARADVWAFGVIAYEMLAGRLPFKSGSAPAALLSVLTTRRADRRRAA